MPSLVSGPNRTRSRHFDSKYDPIRTFCPSGVVRRYVLGDYDSPHPRTSPLFSCARDRPRRLERLGVVGVDILPS